MWFIGLGIYLVVRRLSGFRWSAANRQLALLFLPTVAAVFVSWYLLPRSGAMVLGAVLTLLAGLYAAKTLCAPGSLGTVSDAGAKNHFVFPAGAIQHEWLNRPVVDSFRTGIS